MKKVLGCLTVMLALAGLFLVTEVVTSIRETQSNKKTATASVASQKEILEVRVCPRDGVNIRTGPGTQFSKVEGGPLVKGEKLYVLEEKNGWVRFRVTPGDVGWSAWAKKDLTVPKDQWESENQQNDIRELKRSGLLVRINPRLNEAYVDPVIWHRLDYQTKKNIGRVMAFYCGREKGTNLNWVDIKDRYSGRKLARYSESWGFKVY